MVNILTFVSSRVHCSNMSTKKLRFFQGYGDLGCFTTRPPFSTSFARPVALLPATPEIIDTTFYLYTREHNISPSRLTYKSVNPKFLNSTQTKFIVHGFLQHIDKKWIADLKDALLKLEDCNVIVVDWSKANGFPVIKIFLLQSLKGCINGLIASY